MKVISVRGFFQTMYAAYLVLLSLAPSVAGADENLCFELIRDGDVIGLHRVGFSEAENRTVARISIDIEVSFGPFTLYDYRHRNEEIWDSEGLVRLTTRTDDDGELSFVSADRRNGQLAVRSSSGVGKYTKELLPTSYWNNQTITAGRLLNTQDGRIMRVDVRPVDEARHKMSGDLNLYIDYDRSGRWTGMSFFARDAEVTYRQCSASTPKPQAFSLDDVFTPDQLARDQAPEPMDR